MPRSLPPSRQSEKTSFVQRILGTALGAIDLAGSTARFLSYREMLARTSVAVGQSIDTLRVRFRTLGDRAALPDESIARVSESLRQTTYDAGDSTQTLRALADEAVATGRALEQLAPLGEVLHNSLGVGFDEAPAALARVRTTAEELKTTGGPAALQDQVARLGGILSSVSAKGKADVSELIASVAELGRGRPAAQQAQIQQSVLGRVLSNPEGLRRQLGVKLEDFYDEQGKVRDLPGRLEQVRQMAVRRWGMRAREVLSQSQNFGPEGAAALLAFDINAARAAAQAGLSSNAAKAAEGFRSSDVGTDIARRHRLATDKRDQAGGLLASVQSGLSSVLPENPLLQFALLQLAGRIGAGAIGTFFGGGGGAAGSSVAGRALAAGLGGSGGAILAGTSAAFLNLYGGMKLMGVDKLNAARPQIEAETQAKLELERQGRVHAIVRAAERAATTDPTPEGYARELGPRLIAMLEGVPSQDIPGDEALRQIASGLATGTVPASVSQQAPDLVAALREALRDSPLEIVVHIEDASGHPNAVVVQSRGAQQ